MRIVDELLSFPSIIVIINSSACSAAAFTLIIGATITAVPPIVASCAAGALGKTRWCSRRALGATDGIILPYIAPEALSIAVLRHRSCCQRRSRRVGAELSRHRARSGDPQLRAACCRWQQYFNPAVDGDLSRHRHHHDGARLFLFGDAMQDVFDPRFGSGDVIGYLFRRLLALLPTILVPCWCCSSSSGSFGDPGGAARRRGDAAAIRPCASGWPRRSDLYQFTAGSARLPASTSASRSSCARA